MKLIANDDLVAITFQRGFGFGDEECGIGLELDNTEREVESRLGRGQAMEFVDDFDATARVHPP